MKTPSAQQLFTFIWLIWNQLRCFSTPKDKTRSPKWVNKVSARSREKENKIVAVAGRQHPPNANKRMPQMSLSPLKKPNKTPLSFI